MIIKRKEKSAAYMAAGWRERYAMEYGDPVPVTIHGHKCIKYVYSVSDPYQDANGATWDTIKKQWIN